LRREDALKYWKDEHAELVARVPGVVRYVQNYCVGDLLARNRRMRVSVRCGLRVVRPAEQAAYSAEWQAILEDAATFMDMRRFSAVWAEEHVCL
jgi:uncharacterized protein (TIGR02118 family)